jgi:hypothetical protein
MTHLDLYQLGEKLRRNSRGEWLAYIDATLPLLMQAAPASIDVARMVRLVMAVVSSAVRDSTIVEMCRDALPNN